MSTADVQAVLEQIRGGVIVSCQAYPGEALRRADITAAIAQEVVAGGAAAVRVQGIADIQAVRQAVEVPVIGLIKYGHEGVFITPSASHACSAAQAGANIVAIDATLRPRLGGESFADACRAVHEYCPGVAVMADCASVTDALAAVEVGADIIGTTLAGYTPGYEHARPKSHGVDVEFISELQKALPQGTPIVVEGRLHRPEDLQRVLEMGVFSACVGTAITHPRTLTKWFLAGQVGAGTPQDKVAAGH